MLKWILVLLGVLATLVAVPFVVGLFLPKEHIAASSITLSHPPDSVWKIVRDLGGYPNWWTDVKSSKRETDIGEREVWVQTDATDQALLLEVVELVPSRTMVTRIADEKLPFTGEWKYTIERAGGGSRVMIVEEGEIFNPIFRLLTHYFLGHHGTIDRFLEALGAHFGEDVTPVHVG
jgi:uncharacterized protein YndB with AHSA1/START domain